MQLCYSGGMLSFPACLFCSQHTSILPSLALRCAFVIGHNSSRVFLLSLSFDLKRLLESDLQNVTFNQTFHEYLLSVCVCKASVWTITFVLLFFLLQKKSFYNIDLYKPVMYRKMSGDGGVEEGTQGRPACQNRRNHCARSVLLPFFHAVSIDGNS